MSFSFLLFIKFLFRFIVSLLSISFHILLQVVKQNVVVRVMFFWDLSYVLLVMNETIFQKKKSFKNEIPYLNLKILIFIVGNSEISIVQLTCFPK